MSDIDHGKYNELVRLCRDLVMLVKEAKEDPRPGIDKVAMEIVIEGVAAELQELDS